MSKTIEIYTDGACSGNPGPGGWAATVQVDDGPIDVLTGGDPHTTNNIMEMKAFLGGIQRAAHMPGASGAKVSIHVDSEYVLKGVRDWLPGWKRRNWRTASGDPVKNREIWEEIDEAYQSLSGQARITLHQVKGHSGNAKNDLVDRHAVEARDLSRKKTAAWFRVDLGKPKEGKILPQVTENAIKAGYKIFENHVRSGIPEHLASVQKRVCDGDETLYFINIDYTDLSRASQGRFKGVSGEVHAQFHTEDDLQGLAVNISFELTSIEDAERHLHEIWSRMGYGAYKRSEAIPDVHSMT